MEWRGIRLYKVEAECKSDKRFNSIGVSLDIGEIEKTGDDGMNVLFTYETKYRPDIANLKFWGVISVGGKKAELDGIIARWKKDKMIPKEMFEFLVNLIKYSAETNGVLVAKALNMAPPVVEPRMQVMPKTGKK